MEMNKSISRRSLIQRIKSMPDNLVNWLKAGSQTVFNLLEGSFKKNQAEISYAVVTADLDEEMLVLIKTTQALKRLW